TPLRVPGPEARSPAPDAYDAFSLVSSDLTTGGASLGTCACQLRVLTGTRINLPPAGIGFLRCSAIAPASSPAGATAGPITNTTRSRWLSFFMRAACVQQPVTAAASTCGTKQPSTRGGSLNFQNGGFGTHPT